MIKCWLHGGMPHLAPVLLKWNWSGSKLAWKQRKWTKSIFMCMLCWVVLSIFNTKENYTKESTFFPFSFEIRCSHFGSALTNKEQKEVGSWCIKYFCNTYPPCSGSLVGAATVSFLSWQKFCFQENTHLSWQNFCYDKNLFSWQNICWDKYLSWQT